MGLTKDIFDVTITNIEFDNPYSIKNYKEDALSVLRQTIKDITAKVVIDEKDSQLLTELQLLIKN